MLDPGVGALTPDGWWNIYKNGSISTDVLFPQTAKYRLVVHAKGTAAAAVWPDMQIEIDGSPLARVTVDQGAGQDYLFSAEFDAGMHRVSIAFTNDYFAPREDRNLLVKSLEINEDSGNAAPRVSASVNLDNAQTAGKIRLIGTVADDGRLQPPVCEWQTISGPGTLQFDQKTALATMAGFSASGTYIARFIAFDGEFSSFADVEFTIDSPEIPDSNSVADTLTNGTTLPPVSGNTGLFDLKL